MVVITWSYSTNRPFGAACATFRVKRANLHLRNDVWYEKFTIRLAVHQCACGARAGSPQHRQFPVYTTSVGLGSLRSPQSTSRDVNNLCPEHDVKNTANLRSIYMYWDVFWKGWLPLKCLAIQVACQIRQPRAPFATKSINTPRNSWRVRHEMMMGIWPYSLLPVWESGRRDYTCIGFLPGSECTRYLSWRTPPLPRHPWYEACRTPATDVHIGCLQYYTDNTTSATKVTDFRFEFVSWFSSMKLSFETDRPHTLCTLGSIGI